MMLALLGLSALNCSDAGAKARVEALLAKSTYVADFQKLDDEAKKQLAKDLQEVYDTLEGVAVKKSRLKTLCDPYLDRIPVKKSIDPSVKGDLKAYEKAASVSASPIPAKPHVAPGRVSVSSGSDVPPVGERVHVGRLSLDSSAPAPSPLKAPIVVSGSIKDRLALFQQQSEDMHKRAEAQKGKKDAAQDKRLLELQTALEALRGPLAEARAAFELAVRGREDADRLRETAIEGEMRAVAGERDASENERLAVEGEDKAKDIKESVVVVTGAYGLRAEEVDALSAAPDITQKKQSVFEKYGILEADSAGVAEGKLAMATKAERSVLAADMLSQAKAALEAARLARERMAKARAESTDTRERAAKSKADADALVQQAVEREAHADKILKDLEARFRDLSTELDAMTAGK